MFVSEHAVSCAAANGWRNGPAIAIGEAAERALRALGVDPARATQARADGVVEEFAPTPPERTLLVKGIGGRTILKDWLQARGREVLEWNVYRRAPLETDDLGPVHRRHRRRQRRWIAGSGNNCGFAHPRDARVPLLVPSERVARLATAMGFEHVVVTTGAGAAAVVEALVKLTESGNG